jgi:hypothetical protein
MVALVINSNNKNYLLVAPLLLALVSVVVSIAALIVSNSTSAPY